MYQPRKKNKFSTESDIYKLCSSADMVIVDWDLYGDFGDRAKELVEHLVVNSLEEDPISYVWFWFTRTVLICSPYLMNYQKA